MHIVNRSDKVTLYVKDTLVVQDFSNVFLGSLQGLAQEREVEFSIELALSTVPIFKEPYKITPTKL